MDDSVALAILVRAILRGERYEELYAVARQVAREKELASSE